ncbi:MAG: multicopper oxidase domain-containing protein [Betaproteobacteria bacterium]|nr:multicopper oxidase domain-containing protein [Betaproteobacteria bacterium]MDE2047006.1 multicopper oxidase domain-containing protein [Betaproteobacteria bacterium]
MILDGKKTPWHGLGHMLRNAAALALLAFGLQAQAAIPGITGSVAAGVREFRLAALPGYISAADGVSIYMWGLADDSQTYANGGTPQMQYPAPTLIVNQGERVRIVLRNLLPTRTSLIFPGHVVINTASGVNGFIAREARRNGTVTYEFDAREPGTYYYQSGTQPGLQTEMGLLGALIVRPNNYSALNKIAYNHAGTRYDRETLMVLSEVDPVIHTDIEQQVNAFVATAAANAEKVFTVDMSKRFPQYWFMNGRTSPDTMADNFVGELPAQPYNCLPRMHPGERLLLRVIGAGADLHPLHHHGNNSWTIARDGRMLSSDPAKGANLAQSDYTVRIVPGETYDAIWSWTGEGLGWDIYGLDCPRDAQGNVIDAQCPHTADMRHQKPSDRGRPLPTVLPSELELAYGEFYSGSPYLGSAGRKPVGAGALNVSGGFFHMIHSHNEREIVNGGIYPGGMMTMIIIEPPHQPIGE